MSMEKRLFLALFLSIVFCTFWAYWIQKKQEKWRLKKIKAQKILKTQKKSQEKLKNKEKEIKKNQQIKKIKNEKIKKNELTLKELKGTLGEKEEFIKIETQNYKMEWSTKGGCLKELKFKKYYKNTVNKKEKDWEKKEENWLNILPPFSSKYRSLLLFREFKIKDKEGKEYFIGLDNIIWKYKKINEKNKIKLIFETPNLNGIKYYKIFNIYQDKYFFDWEIVIENTSQKDIIIDKLGIAGGASILIETYPHETTLQNVETYMMYPNPKNQPLFKTIDYSKAVSREIKIKEPVEWIALANRYFAHLLRIENPKKNISYVQNFPFVPDLEWLLKEKEELKLKNINKKKQVYWILWTKKFKIAPNKKYSLNLKFYVHTKEDLEKYDKTYKIINNLGLFGFISNFLLLILGIFYKISGNYGIAIIFLTLLIKIVLHPLTKHQQIEMNKYQQKMKKIQPKIKKLQEKYKNDKKKLNEELMKLYQEHNMSILPFGGCLPIFIQIPIFIGLYQALYHSIKLRQAEFLWIRDLSQPDHLYYFGHSIPLLGYYLNLLPILMTIIWIIQQKLTTTQTDDPQMQQQQKVFLFMTIIFGFMFYSVASGLVLYWLVMNLFGIIEQLIIKKHLSQV